MVVVRKHKRRLKGKTVDVVKHRRGDVDLESDVGREDINYGSKKGISAIMAKADADVVKRRARTKKYTTYGYLRDGTKVQQSTDDGELARDWLDNYDKGYVTLNLLGSKPFIYARKGEDVKFISSVDSYSDIDNLRELKSNESYYFTMTENNGSGYAVSKSELKDKIRSMPDSYGKTKKIVIKRLY